MHKLKCKRTPRKLAKSPIIIASSSLSFGNSSETLHLINWILNTMQTKNVLCISRGLETLFITNCNPSLNNSFSAEWINIDCGKGWSISTDSISQLRQLFSFAEVYTKRRWLPIKFIFNTRDILNFSLRVIQTLVYILKWIKFSFFN